jgi:ParB-like chromosome segregation protein Spo0J
MKGNPMLLALDHLHAHPGNANRMKAGLRKKLADHIAGSGRYPPLIVRPHPAIAAHYEILDGHHRAEILRELKHEQAACEVWPADDAQAALLLVTLNRLHGQDDPLRRGELLESLRATMGLAELRRLVPEDPKKLSALLEAARPGAGGPLALVPAPRLDDMPSQITFFLTHRQRVRLLEHLKQIDAGNPSAALVRLLALNEPA